MPTDTARRPDRHTVFISSTAIDLPDHREQVAEACRRTGYDPVGMGEWPAMNDDAETVSLHRVDAADLFIGVYAFRYGRVPPRHEVSITESKYRQVLHRLRDIPARLRTHEPTLSAPRTLWNPSRETRTTTRHDSTIISAWGARFPIERHPAEEAIRHQGKRESLHDPQLQNPWQHT